MAITTYSELQTAVENWLARDDLTSRVPEFIDLAEGQMSRKLWSKENEKRSETSTTSGDKYLQLPSDVRAIRAARLKTDPPTVLRYAPFDQARFYYAAADKSKPHTYTIYADVMELHPTPDGSYDVEIIYVAGIPPLSNSNSSNTVLDRYPDAYLYGALYNAHEYLMDEERAQFYKKRFEAALDEISMDFERLRYPSGLTMRSDYIPWRNNR